MTFGARYEIAIDGTPPHLSGFCKRGSLCPLRSDSDPIAAAQRPVAMGHNRTHAVQQTKCKTLLDDLVGGGKQRRRHVESQRLCGFAVDHEFKFGCLLDRKVGRLGPLQNAIDEIDPPPRRFEEIRT
jgi:hypothetical protein